jgi:hypothetical protein
LASLICLRHVRKLMWYAPLCDSENSRFATMQARTCSIS